MNLNLKLSKYKPKLGGDVIDTAYYDDDELAPVMPAIDAVQQLMEEEDKISKLSKHKGTNGLQSNDNLVTYDEQIAGPSNRVPGNRISQPVMAAATQIEPMLRLKTNKRRDQSNVEQQSNPHRIGKSSGKAVTRSSPSRRTSDDRRSESYTKSNLSELNEDDEDSMERNNPFSNLAIPFNDQQRQDEYEFIPKSVILDVYSNDPEVKRFLKQLPKISHESGLSEQDYKCYSCRRPIGLVFGQSRLCHYDGHHYCSECHLNEKSNIPARILCNWDFQQYPVSKRNQHFLTLISNESMFELRKVAPLLYKMCPELREIEELRRQAFFVRSYCTTCVQDSISFELTKLIWPREHLIKQTDLYSIDDLVQMKSGALKQMLKNVITFGRQHVLSCVLCCQRGFICELCKSSQIIYPFDTESVHRCNECQSTYHKSCYSSKLDDNACPRCLRLKARRRDE